MKINEVSKLTGLTQKTIRYYEKCDLFKPQYEWKNDRRFRSYTEVDVLKLSVIADLRRALFSTEEIKVMMDSPDAIQGILKTHTAKINKRFAEIETLRNTFNSIVVKVDRIADIFELSVALNPEVKEMPLPKRDLVPRFKHIDAQDKIPKRKEKLAGFAIVNMMPQTKATEILIDNNRMYLE